MKNIKAIGIDVSKDTLDVCITKGIGKDDICKTYKIDNNARGISELGNKLKRLGVDSSIPIALESTGIYHILACMLLSEKGYKVGVINPLNTKYFTSANIRKQKTDKVDAKALADMAILKPEILKTFIPDQAQVMLKKKISTLNKMLKGYQSIKASIKTYQDLERQLQVKESVAIYNLKKSSEAMKKMINEVEQEILEEGRKCTGFEKVSSIKGISDKTTAKILVQIEGKKFDKKESLVAFAGMDISVKESGTSVRGKGRITKRGNPNLRNSLYQAAWGLMMHNEEFKRIYEYHRKNGKHYYTCLTILARKLLHIIYGMLKTNTGYKPELVHIPN